MLYIYIYFMRKKILNLAGTMLLVSNVAIGKDIEDIRWGVNLDGGASLMGATYNAKEGATAQDADMKYFGGASLFFGYNFTKVFGIKVNLGARMLDGFKIKAEQTDIEVAAKKIAKSPVEADVTNATLDVLFTIIPLQYEGGCLRISLGPQATYAFLKEVKFKGTSNKEAEKIIKDMNMDIVLKVSGSFLEDKISAGVIVNYTALDQIDADAVKKIDSIKISTVKFGAGRIKVGASIGFNIVAIIA